MESLTNWNEQITFECERVETPASIEDVQRIVRTAARGRRRIRVVGSLHSTTACFEGDDIIVSMDSMNKVLDIGANTVTAQAGVTLHRLCQALKPLGRKPPVVLEFGEFELGAISGTHANDTAMNEGAQFSSYVTGMKIVAANGELSTVTETDDPELMRVLRSHFGLFGVVCEVTVRTLPGGPMEFTAETFTIDAFRASFTSNVARLKSEYDQVFGMIFPYDGEILFECRRFVDKPASSLGGAIASRGVHAYTEILLPMVRALKGGLASVSDPIGVIELLTGGNFVNRFISSKIRSSIEIMKTQRYTIDACDRGIPYNGPPFDFYDWVFPESEWVAMLDEFLALCKRYESRNFMLLVPTLIYFIREDNASILSRSRDGDAMAIDPTFPLAGDRTWAEFRRDFNEVAMRHRGSPHINKTRDGAIHHFADAHDRATLDAYLKKRADFDPDGVFLNEYFRNLFRI